MPHFSQRSLAFLNQAHPTLRKIALEAIKVVDFSVTDSYRDKELQDKYFKEGKSQKKFPESKHNKFPSLAIDIAPCPLDWKDIASFTHVIGVFKGVASMMGVKLRCGMDWGGFKDYPHIEIIEG